ncbi:hypothetical protein NPIL_45541 [Nephila pilipes]|uniref:Uncharacterized protein n=1 Tax=Nephila pilipes TaxID=299642 RepID=A0A8X6P2L4_NEPPI|nr:hypothetical protein NPIL_45541 [Nephila pilipes]
MKIANNLSEIDHVVVSIRTFETDDISAQEKEGLWPCQQGGRIDLAIVPTVPRPDGRPQRERRPREPHPSSTFAFAVFTPF